MKYITAARASFLSALETKYGKHPYIHEVVHYLRAGHRATSDLFRRVDHLLATAQPGEILPSPGHPAFKARTGLSETQKRQNRRDGVPSSGPNREARQRAALLAIGVKLSPEESGPASARLPEAPQAGTVVRRGNTR